MTGDTLGELVQHLEEKGVLKSPRVKEALLAVDRKNFVPHRMEELAYRDSPLVLAEDQTISQPTTVVFMLELLDVQPGQKVLDIGAGSGWASCLMGYLAGGADGAGEVYAYEINEVVGMMGLENVQKCSLTDINYVISNAKDQWKDHSLYDRIHSGAAFQEIPNDLKQHLAIGGIMVVPTQDGYVKKITRVAEDDFSEEEYYGFTFVPFVEK